MHRIISILALIPALLALCAPAMAEPADIDAAARGVVRVVVIGRDGEEIFPISHGTGFAVDSETFVTNAHVVREALEDERLGIGIVPSDTGEAVYARVTAVSPRNDLALLVTTSPLRLAPLTIAGNPPVASGSVTSIGYPMNVDQAQGLDMQDIFRAQPPVTAPGFLSGRRPSREFDTLLHTAPIARGNSGGPLVDSCGRVIGVNSFGAESDGADAEFFFAVSNRELLPFLRANEVTPRINALPCRSLAELDAEEREREERRQLAARLEAERDEQVRALLQAETRRAIQFAILDERSNRMALAFLLLLVAAGGAAFAWDAHRRADFRARSIGGGLALAALVGSLVAWTSRPGFSQVEERLEEALRAEMDAEDSGVIDAPPVSGSLVCVLDTGRSRVLGASIADLALDYSTDGCLNTRTQYGMGEGRWTRVLVPANEEAVSVNRFEPMSGEYVVERYLLDRVAMRAARTARGEYEAPACGDGDEAARQLEIRQDAIVALLPDRPNERLVYNCSPVTSEEEGAEESTVDSAVDSAAEEAE